MLRGNPTYVKKVMVAWTLLVVVSSRLDSKKGKSQVWVAYCLTAIVPSYLAKGLDLAAVV